MFFNMAKKPLAFLNHPYLIKPFYIDGFRNAFASKYLDKNLEMLRAQKTGKVAAFSFIDNSAFNEEMKKRIESNTPFFVARYGATELSICAERELVDAGISPRFSDTAILKAKKNSGVFPMEQETLFRFTDEYAQAFHKADMNAFWGSLLMEEYLCKRHMPEGCLMHTMRALEPFQYEHPWTESLKGKKVLIVHPFEEEIRAQYEKRKELFANEGILPDFELHTVKAIQTSGTGTDYPYENWTKALEYLEQQCLKEDFDVALLSCGAYAVPLGAGLKKAGKQAIVLGGMLQLIFGIKGERWERSRPDIVALYNDAWIRAGDINKVQGTKQMADGAAYW